MAMYNTIHSVNNSSVDFGAEGYKTLNLRLKGSNYSKLVILTDKNTSHLCRPHFLAKLQSNTTPFFIEIPAGEQHKSIKTCTEVWQKLSDIGADRKSVMINLGGGVVTDLGGFVALTFKRGIDYINIPTTLLAMVDASVGGKTGVDLGSLKNQVGIINPPTNVIIDTHYLKSLSKQELRSGSAEVIKHGLIADKNLWNTLKKSTPQNIDHWDDYIYQSVVIKNKVVVEDPTEKGLRKTLNFGHTLGHAIETHFLQHYGKDHLLHGEAIAIGMLLEAYLSSRLLGFPEPDLEDLRYLVNTHFKNVEFSPLDIEAVIALLKHDKKNTHGNVNFVLLKAIGHCELDVIVEEKLIREAFGYYQTTLGN